ncbi:MAG: hypothetical protein QG629_605 [Patescibacteria group bacterium]|nr:PKD domain-containing protein [Candidatus Saccharibacteria bacterium]MDQ5963523.1 hypothetical protein [Patescibacteria group bacterium]
MTAYRKCTGIVAAFAMLSLALLSPSSALAQSTNPEQGGTTGLQGTIPSAPPKTAATIAVPGSGQTFTSIPVTVSGLCSGDVVVKVFSNNIFVGSAQCQNGSYRLQIDLFGGQNSLVARVYDALDQAGPDSNTVLATFQDGQFAAFGQRVSLTSTLAKNGALVGKQLSWPIVLSGGSGPYALSIDWGDGTSTDLKSISFAGPLNLTHAYKKAGIFRVTVKATDATGAAAFLQLVGVGMGSVSQVSDGQSTSVAGGGKNAGQGGGEVQRIYIWWPVLLLVPFIFATFWIGRRYELLALHRKIEREAKLYENEIQR